MDRCEICGKPTKSHSLGEYYICHSCWTEKTEEIDELKKRIEEEKEQKWSLKEAGKKISEKLDKVSSKEDLYNIFERYQRRLDESLDKDPEGNIYRTIDNEVSEKLCNILFDRARKEGWDFVLEMIERYSLENKDVIKNLPIENVAGRMIILTREEESVEEIPVKALEYLSDFRQKHDYEWEESFSLGWGFDHPEFDFKETIEEAIKEGDDLWASAILERAFYADQKKAAPILIEFLKRNDISNKNKMGLIQSVTFFTDSQTWRRPDKIPRYWNWRKAVGYMSFEWDEEVEESLKAVIEEELADYIEKNQSRDMDVFKRTSKNLPANICDFSEDWSFTDLQI